MKTIAKTLIIISILMISTAALAGNNQPMGGKVIYKVQIHMPKDTPIRTDHVWVIMTDERDQPIAPAQRFTFGKQTYLFTENNSVTGTRKAALIYHNESSSRLFNCTPDAQYGKFVVGGTYLFNIYVAFQLPTSFID